MTDDPRMPPDRKVLKPWHWALIALVATLIFMALLALLIGVQAAVRP